MIVFRNGKSANRCRCSYRAPGEIAQNGSNQSVVGVCAINSLLHCSSMRLAKNMPAMPCRRRTRETFPSPIPRQHDNHFSFPGEHENHFLQERRVSCWSVYRCYMAQSCREGASERDGKRAMGGMIRNRRVCSGRRKERSSIPSRPVWAIRADSRVLKDTVSTPSPRWFYHGAWFDATSKGWRIENHFLQEGRAC
jgi:hypothetical protein